MFFLIPGIPLLLTILNYTQIQIYGQWRMMSDPSLDTIRYVLIPGAGRNYPQSPNPNYSFLGRMDTAAAIWHRHPQIKLILSGYEDNHYYREANDMRDALMKKGVADSALILDPGSIDTRASIDFYFRRFGTTPVVIVSQPVHLERALWLACACGLNAYGYEAGNYPGGTPRWMIVREFGARIKARLEVWGWLTHSSKKEKHEQ